MHTLVVDIEQPHPILNFPAARYREGGPDEPVYEEYSLTEKVTTNMPRIIAGINLYNEILATYSQCMKISCKFLNEYLSREGDSSETMKKGSRSAQKPWRSISGMRALLSSIWRRSTRTKNVRRIENILSQIQSLKDQLSALNLENARSFELIRQEQISFENKVRGKDKSSRSISKVEDVLYFNPKFVGSIDLLLKAFDGCMRLRNHMCSGCWSFSPVYAHLYKEKFIMRHGEQLLGFSQDFIQLAREIQTIAQDMRDRKLNMDCPGTSASPEACV